MSLWFHHQLSADKQLIQTMIEEECPSLDHEKLEEIAQTITQEIGKCLSFDESDRLRRNKRVIANNQNKRLAINIWSNCITPSPWPLCRRPR